MQKRFFLIFFVSACTLFAKKGPITGPSGQLQVQAPWLTGPLLAPSGITIPPGHYNIEPYVYFSAQTGKYDAHWKAKKMETFWNNYFQPSIQFGLLSWLDFQLNPTVAYNHTKGAGQWGWGDMPIAFDFQLLNITKDPPATVHALKFEIKEIVPMGKYQNLDPKKLGTDGIGQGSWQTAFAVTLGNLIYLGKDHFVAIRSNFQYTLPAPVQVKNLNFYGGGPGTRGTVYPAQNFQFDIGTEWTLTRNWVFALDIVGSWSGKTRFKGKTLLSNTVPPSTQFSLAPAIEYNWNGNLGMIFGPWFTVAGRNAIQFATAVFAFNYYH